MSYHWRCMYVWYVQINSTYLLIIRGSSCPQRRFPEGEMSGGGGGKCPVMPVPEAAPWQRTLTTTMTAPATAAAAAAAAGDAQYCHEHRSSKPARRDDAYYGWRGSPSCITRHHRCEAMYVRVGPIFQDLRCVSRKFTVHTFGLLWILQTWTGFNDFQVCYWKAKQPKAKDVNLFKRSIKYVQGFRFIFLP